MKFKGLLVVVIFLLALFVRFYNFGERITFGPEQAISLITSGRMITEKFSLLGVENVQRVTSTGHRIFSGVVFSYSLIPLQILFKFDPLPITAYFSLVNILTGLALYFLSRKMFKEKVALFATVLFLFSSQMIYHSLFIWILNYLPLVGLLTFYFLFKLRKDQKKLYPFVLGILSGLGLSFEYLYFFTGLIVLLIVLYYSKKKWLSFALFTIGGVLPNLPTIVFDIRHGYYHAFTLWQYLLDVVNGVNSSSLSYYHFLQFWPLMAIAGGILLIRLYQRQKFLAIFFVSLFLYLNLKSSFISFNTPTGMPRELTLANIYSAARIIKEDSPKDFNVAVLVDFDTRGHILRYPLEFKYGIKPLGVIDYPISQSLYVLAEKGYNFEEPGVWELTSFSPYKTKKLESISSNYSIFKLTK